MAIPLWDDNPFEKSRPPVITWAIIAANVLIFMIEAGMSEETLLALLANYAATPATIIAEPANVLPLFTSQFLHHDIIHLLGNMLFLFIFGDDVEEAMGPLRFVGFYLTCGAVGAAGFVVADPSATTPLIGASGAVSGVMAAYVMLKPRAKIATLIQRLVVRIDAIWVVLIWLVWQIWEGFNYSDPEVAYVAHIVGFFSGAALFPVLRRRDVKLFQFHPSEQAGDGQTGAAAPTFVGSVLLGSVLLLVFHFLNSYFTERGLFAQAVALQQEGRCEAAIEKFTASLRYNPKSLAAHLERGNCHLRLSRLDLALRDFERAIQDKPDAPEPYYNRGLIRRAQGDIQGAEADWREASRLKPSEPDAHMRLAELLTDQDRLDEAIAEYERVPSAGPKYREAQLRRAELLRAKGAFADALAGYELLAKREPNNASMAVFGRAATLRMQGDSQAASSVVEEGLRRWPNLATGYLERGVLELFYKREPAKAAADLAKALELGLQYRQQNDILEAASQALRVEEADRRPKLAPDLLFGPAIYHLILHLHIARLQSGQGADDLKKEAAKVELSWGDLSRSRALRWPGPLFQMFAGMIGPDEVLRSVDTAGSSRAVRCEAYFYTAEYHRLASDNTRVLPLLSRALSECPRATPLRELARAELSALGKPNSIAQ